jgi:sialic acid synthase SpsE/CMP-N-acetylneuraminic acid synthetase
MINYNLEIETSIPKIEENNRHIISIIPARGGSKGIPRKNLLHLYGHPLIAYSIRESLNAELIDETYVSSEDREILKVAKEYGAKTILRPSKLATDEASTESVLLHTAKYLNKEFDYLVLLQPTSPIRKSEQIDEAIMELINSGDDSLVSVCRSNAFLWDLRSVHAEPINYIPFDRPRRQEMHQYRENGSLYITKREILLKTRNRLGGNTLLYEMPEWMSYEIDTPLDAEIIRFLMQQKEFALDFRIPTVPFLEHIFFIAEIGINHNGSMENAKKLIDMAVKCGADAVKFQKRVPELCVPEWKKDQIRQTPWGKIPYLEYKKKIEFGGSEYRQIDEYCKQKNIPWFASPWDVPSAEFLEQFNIPYYKIASAKLTDRRLLETVRDFGKLVFLSTGMSTEAEIRKAVEILGENTIILHCNSSYPAPDKELNLNYIKTLQNQFPEHIIGYSGHEFGISASLIAAELGAKVIERHITLDRAMWGSDQSASIEFSGLRRLIRNLRKLEKWKGDGIKRITEKEQKAREKLRNVKSL